MCIPPSSPAARPRGIEWPGVPTNYMYISIITCGLHGRVVKGVGHLEAMEAGGCEFDLRPGHYSSRLSF